VVRLLLLLLVIAGLALLAQITGLINIDATGRLRAPSVDVSVHGGEMPKVQVETAKVKVGTTERTVKLPEVDIGTQQRSVELPAVDIDKARDDGSAAQ